MVCVYVPLDSSMRAYTNLERTSLRITGKLYSHQYQLEPAHTQPNIMKAKKKKIETLKPEDLGLDFVSSARIFTGSSIGQQVDC